MELSPKTRELVAATEAMLNDGKATIADAEALQQRVNQRLAELEIQRAHMKTMVIAEEVAAFLARGGNHTPAECDAVVRKMRERMALNDELLAK